MKNLAIILGLILVLGTAAYFLIGNEAGSSAEAGQKEFSLVVAEKKLVSGPAVMTVKKGDLVVIKITNDTEEEFHLHGYDKSVDLEPNTEATLTLLADTAGRFPAELEVSKTELVTLEVLP